MTSLKRPVHLTSLALVVIGLIGAAVFTVSFPAVEGLGTKVRLPVFHGAMTWVNLAAFSLVAVAAVCFLATRRDWFYRAAEGLRWVAVSMWFTGSVLGLLAALNTWDFTGSMSSPLQVAAADPRLLAQLWILLAALALLALDLIFDDRRVLAVGDIGFVALMWTVIMRAVLGPGRALHPDSPVMNSDELSIKLLFFGIVGSLAVASLAAGWFVAHTRAVRSAADAGSAASGDVAAR